MRQLVFRTDRDEARERGTKYTEARGRVEPFTEEQLAEFYELYDERGNPRRHAALLGRRQRRRSAAAHDEGPDDRHRLHRYAQGWGGLYIRANKLAWKMQHDAPGPRHHEPLQRAGLPRARALGRGLRARGRRARRL